MVSSSYAKDTNDIGSSPKSEAIWTEADWIQWWNGIEDLYLSGMSEEGLYWLLKHDLEVLGQSVEILDNFPFPPPDPNWGGGGGDPTPPTIMKSGKNGKEPVSSKYAQYPSEWIEMLNEYGLDYRDFQGIHVPPPPMWLAASTSLFGTNLSQVRHPATSITGYVVANIGGLLIIWIEVENSGDDEDE